MFLFPILSQYDNYNFYLTLQQLLQRLQYTSTIHLSPRSKNNPTSQLICILHKNKVLLLKFIYLKSLLSFTSYVQVYKHMHRHNHTHQTCTWKHICLHMYVYFVYIYIYQSWCWITIFQKLLCPRTMKNKKNEIFIFLSVLHPLRASFMRSRLRSVQIVLIDKFLFITVCKVVLPRTNFLITWYTSVCCDIIYDSCIMEPRQVFKTNRMDKENVVYIHNGFFSQRKTEMIILNR